MDRASFEAELKAAGYTEIEAKTLEARSANPEHAHNHDIRGLVVDGLFIVRQDGKAATYRAGEIFTVPAGISHSEEIGEPGAAVVVGRKYR
jgi:quercetin dioxygenase-like cupin family protein